MLNFTGVAKAPIRFEVTMKPTGLAKKRARICPEYVTTISASDRHEATDSARKQAAAEGFAGYAITKIKEIKK